MKTFTPVYNMVSSRFFRLNEDAYPSVSDVLDGEDYFHMPSIKANDLEEVFHILNMEHPEEHIAEVKKFADLDPLHVKYPSLHTSMSVGDVVADETDPENVVYYYCDSCGWKELEVA